MIAGEISRISDHFTCIGACALELGAFTPFLYGVEARELVWDLHRRAVRRARHQQLRAHRRRVRRRRPGVPGHRARASSTRRRTLQKDLEDLLLANPIFRERMEGIGVLLDGAS